MWTLQWRHNERDGVSNHQPHDCLIKTSKLRVTGLWVGNSPVTGEFPAQMVSNAEYFHLMTSSWECDNPYFSGWTGLIGTHSITELLPAQEIPLWKKTIVRSSYLQSEISYTGKPASFSMKYHPTIITKWKIFVYNPSQWAGAMKSARTSWHSPNLPGIFSWSTRRHKYDVWPYHFPRHRMPHCLASWYKYFEVHIYTL